MRFGGARERGGLPKREKRPKSSAHFYFSIFMAALAALPPPLPSRLLRGPPPSHLSLPPLEPSHFDTGLFAELRLGRLLGQAARLHLLCTLDVSLALVGV